MTLDLLKKCAIYGLGFIASLVGIDIYLQVAEIQTPMETRIDPDLGPTYIPNMRITRFNEGFFMGSTNAYGYMGPGEPPRRRGAEKRILLLGDSFVLGHTVLPRNYFGRHLESRLRALTGQEVKALNFGKADFNIGNMFQYFEDFAGNFDHDLALFFVGGGDLVPTGQVSSGLYPAVRLEGDRIVIDRTFNSTWAYRFYRAIDPFMVRSSILRLAFNTYKVIYSGSWRNVAFDKLASWFFPADPAEEAVQEQSPPPPEIPLINRLIIQELAKDPRNVLVIQTPLASDLIKEIQTTKIPIIDLGRFLDDELRQGRDPYYWPITGMRGHWNNQSQPLIGNFMADRINELGFL